MNSIETENAERDHCADEYLADIPGNVWDLLVPVDPEKLSDFCAATKKLRIREVERDYVMDLQRVYRIPIRPNESVKATMIRVRLKIFKHRFKALKAGNRDTPFGNLPVDPLE